MAEIEEIPIDAQEPIKGIPENNEGNTKELQENTLAPKKRGRPAGAKNKPKPPAPPKPASLVRPKAASRDLRSQAKEEYEDWSEEDEESVPMAPPPTPAQELDRHALAGKVLSILQQQRYNQTSARRNHYASWFANM